MQTLDTVIGESTIFRGLSHDHLALIAGCASNTGFGAGEPLFREGDPADVFFLVRRGSVAIDSYVPHRGRLTIETAGPGDIVGWSWLLPPHRWHFTGRVVEEVRAVQFDGACLREKAEADPTLGYELITRFAQMLVARLQATRHQLVDVYGAFAAPHPGADSSRDVRTLDTVIGESTIFRGLSHDHLALIAGCASNTGFGAGEPLFREGDPADVFFLVRRGIVAMDSYVPHRGRLTIQTAGPGDIVGWSWLLPPHRWHFTGRVVEAVRAVQFDGACLREKVEADPALGYELTTRFAQLLVARLQATQHQLVDVYGAFAPPHPEADGSRADDAVR